MHHSNSAGDSFIWPTQIDYFIFDNHMTLVGPIHAKQNVDERTFARPIFTKECQYSPWLETYGDVVVRQNTWEFFSNFARTEKSFCHAQPFS